MPSPIQRRSAWDWTPAILKTFSLSSLAPTCSQRSNGPLHNASNRLGIAIFASAGVVRRTQEVLHGCVEIARARPGGDPFARQMLPT
eukprot:1023251-Pyramimonas_sp.AAC.1